MSEPVNPLGALRDSDHLIRDARKIMFRWLEGRELTERAALDQLVGLLDSPRQRAIQNATRLALGEEPEPANDAGTGIK